MLDEQRHNRNVAPLFELENRKYWVIFILTRTIVAYKNV